MHLHNSKHPPVVDLGVLLDICVCPRDDIAVGFLYDDWGTLDVTHPASWSKGKCRGGGVPLFRY